MKGIAQECARKELKRRLYLVASIAITVAVLIYVFQKITMQSVIDLLLNASWRGIAAFLVCSFAMSVFRTWRYRLMLQVLGEAPSSIALFLVVIVRNFCSDLLPARLGSLVYVFLVNTRLGVRLDSATSTFALATIFDAIGLVPIIAIGIALVGSTAGAYSTFLLIGVAIVAILSIASLLLLPKILQLSLPVLRVLERAGLRWVRTVSELVAGITDKVQAIAGSGIYFRVFVLSFLGRLCKYAGIYFFIFALLNPLGYSIAVLDPAKVFLGVCASELSASLPISGIGGFGLYQGTWVVVFKLLGFSAEIASTTALSHTIFSQAYACAQAIIGIVLLALPVWAVAETRSARTQVGGAAAFLLLVLASVVSVGGALAVLLS